MDDIIKNNPEVSLIPFKEVEEKIVVVRDQKVLLDRDVAELYGVETKRINEAVRNNPRKFREGYMFELTSEESSVLRSKFSTLEQTNGKGRHSKYNFKAFTERGLYMLATILKSQSRECNHCHHRDFYKGTWTQTWVARIAQRNGQGETKDEDATFRWSPHRYCDARSSDLRDRVVIGD